MKFLPLSKRNELKKILCICEINGCRHRATTKVEFKDEAIESFGFKQVPVLMCDKHAKKIGAEMEDTNDQD